MKLTDSVQSLHAQR